MPAVSSAPEAPPALQPKVQDLGDQRYRIGLIEVDMANGRMSVPGAVLRNEPPLEFLAVTTGGFKAYESLIELGASAYEFNVGCILLGLDPTLAVPSHFHFDPKPAEGDPVEVFLEWKKGDELVRIAASELITMDGKALPDGEWVYTGSVVAPDGQYMAHIDGTVIGFVHDPSTIIEHRSGFGLGKFGEVEANRKLLPPVGTRLTVVLEKKPKS